MNLIVKVTSPDRRAALSRLLQAPLGIDVWEARPEHLVVRANESQIDRIERLGYAVEQLRETDNLISTFATAESLSTYHSAESLETDLRTLAEDHPEVARVHEIGRSVEGLPILALQIGDRHGSDRKLLFTGCHHAREWIAVEVPYLLAQHMVEHANDAPFDTWLSDGEVWVVPMVNPDGHEHSRVEERLWRKNRRRNPDGSIGVDPNRNYGYMWGTLDIATSSHVPSDDTYVGPRAFSEPETRAVRDLVGRELFTGVISYHSYSQLILYPWGYTQEPIADEEDLALMTDLAAEMSEQIEAVHGLLYSPQQSSELYPTAGDTTDWTYGIYGVPSLTFELRPDSVDAGGFILPPEEIEPAFEENLPAALAYIDRVL